MKRIVLAACAAVLVAAAAGSAAFAASKEKMMPFVLASKGAGNMAATVAEVSGKLTGAGLDIVGSHSPFPTATILIVTNDAMKAAAAKSEKGGFGAAQRVSITDIGGEIQVAYTNPKYMAAAYRMDTDFADVAATMEGALGRQMEYGPPSGKTDRDMRDYHYMFGMEYFTDPHYLSRYNKHADAVAAVEKGLAAATKGITKVYRIDLPGKDETVFGVAMNGKGGAGDQQDDAFLMKEIDFKPIRSTAHLPYEMLVTDGKVYALSARFRIAINFPDLAMMGDNSFMNIMDSPTAIKEALTAVAGDTWEKK